MAKIRCPDGVLRDYADYDDNVKPLWKEQMAKEHQYRCKVCGKILTDEEAENCKGYCPECLKSSF